MMVTSPVGGVHDFKKDGKLPTNRYGSSRFLVKLQNPLHPQDQAAGVAQFQAAAGRGPAGRKSIQDWELDEGVIRRNFYQNLMVRVMRCVLHSRCDSAPA